MVDIKYSWRKMEAAA